jgi:hypothetical protein
MGFSPVWNEPNSLSGDGEQETGNREVTGGFAAAEKLGREVLPPSTAGSAHDFLFPVS